MRQGANNTPKSARNSANMQTGPKSWTSGPMGSISKFGARFALYLALAAPATLATACSSDEEPTPLCVSTESTDLVLTRAELIKARGDEVLSDIKAVLASPSKFSLAADTPVITVLSAPDDPKLDEDETDGLVPQWGGLDSSVGTVDSNEADSNGSDAGPDAGSDEWSTPYESNPGLHENTTGYGVGRTPIVAVALDPNKSGLENIDVKGLPVTAVQCASNGDGHSECVVSNGFLQGQYGPLRIYDIKDVEVDGDRIVVTKTTNSKADGEHFSGRVIVDQVKPEEEYPGSGSCKAISTPGYDGSKGGEACDVDKLNTEIVYDDPMDPSSGHSIVPHTKTPSQECSVMVDETSADVDAANEAIKKAAATAATSQ